MNELKEKIENMSAEELQEKTCEALSKSEKGQCFYAGMMAAMRSISIRPEDFTNECRTNA